jgi:putative SOS response-associated peptidase YedK
MCGRFLLQAPVDVLQRAFGFAERPNLQPRYNVAPTQTVPIVRQKGRSCARRMAVAASSPWCAGA